MKRETKRRNNKGFSLVELIIVIAIMAILAGILAPQFIKYINKSKISTDIQNAQQIATAISTEYSNDATLSDATKRVFPADITFSKVSDLTDAQKAVLGGKVPAVKAKADTVFAIKLEKGQVTVYAVAKDATDATGAATLYPETTGDWAQK